MKVYTKSYDLDHDASVFESLAEKALDNGDYAGWELYTKLSETLTKLANQYDILNAEQVIE